MRAGLARVVALALSLAGCASGEPFCSNVVDMTGRAIVFCPDSRRDPVCDRPGQEAHFEDETDGWILVGGERALCNDARVVECPRDTVGEPYCITDPDR